MGATDAAARPGALLNTTNAAVLAIMPSFISPQCWFEFSSSPFTAVIHTHDCNNRLPMIVGFILDHHYDHVSWVPGRLLCERLTH
jgi:hypothetical protein